MNLDHEAIRKAYSEAVVIHDDFGVFDKDEKEITIDNAKVTAARKAIDDAWAAEEYKRNRASEYPSWQDQLDYIYHNGIDKWKTDIVAPVKNKYPKP
tara:strand:+ start:549 stop:839 length:291 start_codon:yes stop_codon:yes gene_type:complete